MERPPAEQWQQLEALFAAALARPEKERAAFLDQSCGDNPELRAELSALIEADKDSEDFLSDIVEDGAASLVVHARDWIGQRLGPYRVLREIGRGGMSSVYAAERDDTEYRKEVAIKLIRRGMDTDDMLRRFRDERQILAALEHPNIARLYDGGTTEDGLPYFVLEYVDGMPIDAYCDHHRMTLVERLHLFRQVCAAVQYAHGNLIVHRDIKPSNVLVTAEGVPKLLDFGIAKWLDPAQNDPSRTRPHERPMTPRYASPEQMDGRTLTTSSDVYSLGILLYELLTGQPPYPEQETDELRRAIQERPPRLPSSAASGSAAKELRGDLDNILRMALRRDPSRRYPSAEQLSADLQRHLTGHPVLARPDTWWYRARKFARRHRLGVAAALVITALLLTLVGSLWVQSELVTRERDRARRALNLVNDLFEIADPGEVRGSTITARELLDRGASRVAGLADEPDTAVLLQTLARLYEELGLYPSAIPLRERALEIFQETHGEQHEDTADALSQLARSLAMQGDFERAEPAFERAWNLRQELQGPIDPRTLRDLNGLALTTHDLGDYQKAARLYEEGFEIFRRLGKEEQAQAFLPSNIALLYHDMGEYAVAEERYREILAIRQEVLGPEHPKTADAADALGMVLTSWGRFQEAEPLLRQSYRLRLKILGEQHREIARSRTHLGRLLVASGRLDEAEELLQQAWAQRKALIGETHPEMAATLEALALWHLARGENAQAEQFYRQALEIYRHSLPDGHPLSTESLIELGLLYEQQGKMGDAESLLREAWTIRQRVFESTAWPLAEARNAFGGWLAANGQPSKARELLENSTEPLIAELGPQHARTLRAKIRLDQTLSAP